MCGEAEQERTPWPWSLEKQQVKSCWEENILLYYTHCYGLYLPQWRIVRTSIFDTKASEDMDRSLQWKEKGEKWCKMKSRLALDLRPRRTVWSPSHCCCHLLLLLLPQASPLGCTAAVSSLKFPSHCCCHLLLPHPWDLLLLYIH